MTNKYFIIAKYASKYGLILYAAKVSDNNLDIDLENVYIYTLYFKGKGDNIKVNEIYEFSTVKGENGLNYCFFV